MSYAKNRTVPIQLDYLKGSLSEALKNILGKPSYADVFDTNGIVNLKWPRAISDGEKLKMLDLLSETSKYAVYVNCFKPEHIEKGLTRTSIVLRLIVSPDLI